MAETRRKFDADFKEGAVRLVQETGKPIAQVARDLGINQGTLGNWVNADRRRGDETGCPRSLPVTGFTTPGSSPPNSPRTGTHRSLPASCGCRERCHYR